MIEPATEATHVRRPPAWAGKRQNLLGLVPFSRCHYFGVVAINDSVIEALLDMGGAKSLVDVDTVEQMGLEVKQGEEGYFWGPRNTATPYYGR